MQLYYFTSPQSPLTQSCNTVYAKHFRFEPSGRQLEWFDDENAIQPVHPDILIAKLRPGQAMKMTLHCNNTGNTSFSSSLRCCASPRPTSRGSSPSS